MATNPPGKSKKKNSAANAPAHAVTGPKQNPAQGSAGKTAYKKDKVSAPSGQGGLLPTPRCPPGSAPRMQSRAPGVPVHHRPAVSSQSQHSGQQQPYYAGCPQQPGYAAHQNVQNFGQAMHQNPYYGHHEAYSQMPQNFGQQPYQPNYNQGPAYVQPQNYGQPPQHHQPMNYGPPPAQYPPPPPQYPPSGHPQNYFPQQQPNYSSQYSNPASSSQPVYGDYGQNPSLSSNPPPYQSLYPSYPGGHGNEGKDQVGRPNSAGNNQPPIQVNVHFSVPPQQDNRSGNRDRGRRRTGRAYGRGQRPQSAQNDPQIAISDTKESHVICQKTNVQSLFHHGQNIGPRQGHGDTSGAHAAPSSRQYTDAFLPHKSENSQQLPQRGRGGRGYRGRYQARRSGGRCQGITRGYSHLVANYNQNRQSDDNTDNFSDVTSTADTTEFGDDEEIPDVQHVTAAPAFIRGGRNRFGPRRGFRGLRGFRGRSSHFGYNTQLTPHSAVGGGAVGGAVSSGYQHLSSISSPVVSAGHKFKQANAQPESTLKQLDTLDNAAMSDTASATDPTEWVDEEESESGNNNNVPVRQNVSHVRGRGQLKRGRGRGSKPVNKRPLAATASSAQQMPIASVDDQNDGKLEVNTANVVDEDAVSETDKNDAISKSQRRREANKRRQERKKAQCAAGVSKDNVSESSISAAMDNLDVADDGLKATVETAKDTAADKCKAHVGMVPKPKHVSGGANDDIAVDENGLFWHITKEFNGRCQVQDLEAYFKISDVERIMKTLDALNAHRLKLWKNNSDASKSVVFVYIKGLRTCAYAARNCNKGSECAFLHMCPAYLAGWCAAEPCRYNHNIRDSRNLNCLSKSGLSDATIEDLHILAIARSSNLAVCPAHNKLGGIECHHPESCLRLHVCNDFLLDRCLIPDKECEFGHDLNTEQNGKILSLFELKHMLVPAKRAMLFRLILTIDQQNFAPRNYRCEPVTSHTAQEPQKSSSKRPNRRKGKAQETLHLDDTEIVKESSVVHTPVKLEPFPSKSAVPVDLADVSLCTKYDFHECNSSDRCDERHDELMPYLWRIKRNGLWIPVDNNTDVEEDYCCPFAVKSSARIKGTNVDINFTNMISERDEKVQRLSTPSYVNCREKTDATKWLWYWNTDTDSNKMWMLYEEDEPPYQDVLESKFLFDPTQTCCFEIGQFQYELDFAGMIQTNMVTKKVRGVCRRPKFVSERQLMVPAVLHAAYHFDPSKLPLNEGWAPMDTETLHWTDLVPMSNKHNDTRHIYSRVFAEFHLTLPKEEYLVHRIYHVQNLALWSKFKEHKVKMEASSPRGTAGERSLFHGTPDEATVRCICYQNFDPRMHGKHGVVYGKGAYFSTTAKYSNSYASALHGGHRFMFYARVLVGQSALGKSEYQRPPPLDIKRPHGALYDSCVNDISQPTIIVVFDRDQCYPEFLIEYEELKSKNQPTTPLSSPSSSFTNVSQFSSNYVNPASPKVATPVSTSRPSSASPQASTAFSPVHTTSSYVSQSPSAATYQVPTPMHTTSSYVGQSPSAATYQVPTTHIYGRPAAFQPATKPPEKTNGCLVM